MVSIIIWLTLIIVRLVQLFSGLDSFCYRCPEGFAYQLSMLQDLVKSDVVKADITFSWALENWN
jgi:hypothetical protein